MFERTFGDVIVPLQCSTKPEHSDDKHRGISVPCVGVLYLCEAQVRHSMLCNTIFTNNSLIVLSTKGN